MKFSKMLVAITLMLSSSYSFAEWSYFTQSNSAHIYADLGKLKNKGSISKLWTLNNYAEVQKTKSGKEYFSTMELTEYDCKGEQRRNISWIAKENIWADGNVIVQDNSIDEWTPIVPGSIGEDSLKVACGYKKVAPEFKISGAEKWKKVSSTDTGEQFVDDSKHRSNKGITQAFILFNYNNSLENGAMSDVRLYEFDCAEDKQRQIAFIDFSLPMAEGEKVEYSMKTNKGSIEWGATVPGSIGENWQTAVCGKQ